MILATFKSAPRPQRKVHRHANSGNVLGFGNGVRETPVWLWVPRIGSALAIASVLWHLEIAFHQIMTTNYLTKFCPCQFTNKCCLPPQDSGRHQKSCTQQFYFYRNLAKGSCIRVICDVCRSALARLGFVNSLQLSWHVEN